MSPYLDVGLHDSPILTEGLGKEAFWFIPVNPMDFLKVFPGVNFVHLVHQLPQVRNAVVGFAVMCS